jgi:hypothetical protein
MEANCTGQNNTQLPTVDSDIISSLKQQRETNWKLNTHCNTSMKKSMAIQEGQHHSRHDKTTEQQRV